MTELFNATAVKLEEPKPTPKLSPEEADRQLELFMIKARASIYSGRSKLVESLGPVIRMED